MNVAFLCHAILVSGSGSGWQDSGEKPHCRAELISEVSQIAPGEPFWVAVRFRMDPGWHIYWTNPGDSGVPTTVKWTLPEGFKAGLLQWPAPERFEEGGMVNYGFQKETVALCRIEPPKSLKHGSKVSMKATANWMVCQEMCVPGSAELSIGLQAGSAAKYDTTEKPLIDLAVKGLPKTDALKVLRVEVLEKEIKLLLFVGGGLKEGWKAQFFASKAGVIEPGAPQSISFQGQHAEVCLLTMARSASLRQIPATLDGVLVVKYEQNRTAAYLVKAPIR